MCGKFEFILILLFVSFIWVFNLIMIISCLINRWMFGVIEYMIVVELRLCVLLDLCMKMCWFF